MTKDKQTEKKCVACSGRVIDKNPDCQVCVAVHKLGGIHKVKEDRLVAVEQELKDLKEEIGFLWQSIKTIELDRIDKAGEMKRVLGWLMEYAELLPCSLPYGIELGKKLRKYLKEE